MKNALPNWATDAAQSVTGWRRHLHQRPELEFETFETAAFVSEKLRAFGCDMVHEMLDGAAVVARIDGARSGKSVALRADMDALPISEASGVDWASQRPGRMHACGHDGHTAIILGVARHLCETRDFAGSVVLIFQPAEEYGGGANAMLKAGLLDVAPFDEVYGAHNESGLAIGSFGCRSGAFAASTNSFVVTLHGRGCHAAQPQDGRNPLMGAALLLPQLTAIPGRLTPVQDTALLSVTSLTSDTDAFNVLPNRTTMKGTVRTLSESAPVDIEQHFRRIVTSHAAACDLSAEIDWRPGYPVLVNTPAQTDHAAEAADLFGPTKRDWPAQMGTEDFAFFLQKRPGAYILYGNGNSAPAHHPAYDFADDALPWAMAWFDAIARRRLAALAGDAP